ncbi:MAG: YcdB/YcdC domain-containing protein, partial [Methylocystaceae bacterium]
MMKTRLKLTALLVISLLAVSLLPSSVYAANVSSTSLAQAIQKVKQNFVIPAGCTEFTSNYSDADNHQVLSLSWNTPQSSGNGGYFNAQVDVATGEIIGMNQWKPTPPGQTTQIPRLSVAAAGDLGNKMLTRLLPSRVKSLRPLANNQLMSLSGYSSPSCSLRWQRYVGNIPVTSDIANMDIDLVTGQINSFNLNWTALDLPLADKAITAEQAMAAFKAAGVLELSYQVPIFYGPLTTTEKGKTPFLVYQVSHPSSGMIDALTGKPLALEPGHYVAEVGGYGGLGGMDKMNSAKAQEASQLTPQEQSEVDNTAKLMAQEEAEALVKKLVMSQFGTDFTLRYINLEKDWRNPNEKAWSLNWVGKQQPSGEMGPSLYARINAVTGELISFSYDPMRGNNSEDKLTREQAQKVGEDFIKQVAPTRVNEVRLSPLPTPYRYPASPYNFRYQRMVGDIVCPGNGIELNIDPLSGKVTFFSLDWNSAVFPPATSVMGLDQAYSQFTKLAPLTLTYAPEWGPQGLVALRLIYRPLPQTDFPDVVIIDATRGIRLDSQGKPLVSPPHAFAFTDIKGAYGEKEISILGQAGLMGEYSTAFKPGEAVHLVNLLRAMQGCRNGVYAINGQSDVEIMKQARDSGLLKENLAATTVVTRELFSRLLTRYLG